MVRGIHHSHTLAHVLKFQLKHRRNHSQSGADKSLARPGRKQANVSVRMACISFDALPCRKKKTWWQLASRCCWNRSRPWHASELVSVLVGLRTYQHPVKCWNVKTVEEIFFEFCYCFNISTFDGRFLLCFKENFNTCAIVWLWAIQRTISKTLL